MYFKYANMHWRITTIRILQFHDLPFAFFFQHRSSVLCFPQPSLPIVKWNLLALGQWLVNNNIFVITESFGSTCDVSTTKSWMPKTEQTILWCSHRILITSYFVKIARKNRIKGVMYRIPIHGESPPLRMISEISFTVISPSLRSTHSFWNFWKLLGNGF